MSAIAKSLPVRASRAIAALVVAASTVTGAALGAPTDARAQDFGSAGAPAAETTARALEPSPSPDPWYRMSAPDAAIAPGTILDVRPVSLPLGATVVPNRSWQLRYRTTDSHGRPIAAVTTVVVPAVPAPAGGARPLVALAQPIDSLGLQCAPSWSMLHSPAPEAQLAPSAMLARGWAVTIPDHQGPRMAYAAGHLAGHAMLEAVRATTAFHEAGLAHSPVALDGYSGGAIATGWAAQLQPAYSPELGERIVGAVAGGTPADPSLLFDTLDGGPGSGLFRAALIGMAREYDQLHPLFNHLGAAVAAPMRDMCADRAGQTGILPLPAAAIAMTPDLRNDPAVREVMRANTMGAEAPEVPVLLYHGSPSVGIGDQFVPERGALRVRDQWCARGGRVTYQPVFGEHILAQATSLPPRLQWIEDRFAGRPLAGSCRA